MALASPVERTLSWALFGLLAVGSVIAIAADATSDDSSGTDTETTGAPYEAEAIAPAVEGPRSFTIAATGDILVHESVAAAAATTDGWDFSSMFASVAPILTAADLAVCHVESPLSPDNTSLSYYPVFNVPNELATAIAGAGYDTCSLASNHALDTGRAGVEGTVAALDEAGVRHAGMARSAAEAETINLIDVDGVTVAHLSYSYGFNIGDPPADAPYLSNAIDEATILSEASRARAAGAEFVLVSLHWGDEYVATPNDTQADLGPRLLGSPAIDLLIGHSSHVVQPVTTVGAEYIAYGLGNFLSNQSPESCTGCPPGTQDGVILQLTVTEDETGRFVVTDTTHTPTWVDRTTYEIVPVLLDAERDPTVLAASADRTAVALSAMGVAVPAGPVG